MVDEEKEKQQNTKWLRDTVTEGNPNLRDLILYKLLFLLEVPKIKIPYTYFCNQGCH